jgi:hypothetical protein
MNRFMTRLLLNGYPSAEHYERLHAEMKKRGFSRVIESSEPNFYWLPNGTYYRVSSSTREQVLADAKAAAAIVSREYEVVVTDAPNCTWCGLKLATAADAMVA